MVYQECGSSCPKKCSAPSATCADQTCVDGCFCPDGTVLHNGQCFVPDQCPCTHDGKDYQQGEMIPHECNTCKCHNRNWMCNETECPAICSSFGDSHYTTFDGKHYDLLGNCDYVLAKSLDENRYPFEIITENVPCGSNREVCTKAIQFNVGTPGTSNFYHLSLIRGRPIEVDSRSPFEVKSVGNFVYVTIPGGVTLQWDRGTQIYVQLTAEHKGKVEGLCGNFNGNTRDDFKGRQGGPPLIKVTDFGNEWKVHDYCQPPIEYIDTCLKNAGQKAWAKQKCDILSNKVFEPCHSLVDYHTFHDKCMLDACACDIKGECEGICTTVAAYAHECAVKGTPIDWRSSGFCRKFKVCNYSFVTQKNPFLKKLFFLFISTLGIVHISFH
ncbi:hypothetical protein LOTGIDRAFT_226093 [Lottia gigantea]|uniref:VWFD domain-containing protein n=1 Tax=Lottia gigantea TaxID=225164 RepID=V4ARB5_LOTGI|nr:hypothetical protein LOTGIDRAFT_226093 [Lottia gigantea]ESO99797.1 hypothetical protein LOTGIDRAFT_226093 [Lottia gigantea]